MRSNTNRTAAGLLLAACAACASAAAPPVAFPARPIRLVVPYPPGASNDILARALAQRLTAALGQNVIVDNRAGAGGHIGAEMVARAPADGHTLLLGTSGIVSISPSVYRKLAYRPGRDLAPVTLFANVPYVFAAGAALPAAGIKELIALAKSRPGQLNYASSGNASAPHLCGELLKTTAGIDLVHVPYKGGAQAVADVISGQAAFYCGGIPTVLGQLKAGKLRSLGVASAQRSALLPDAPTVAEQGLPGFEVSSWTGILVPAATPGAIVERLHAEIARVMDDASMRAYVTNQGAEPAALGPRPFRALIDAETAKWAKVVKATGMKID
jgi:tripartite-type tricarboxylate transporter receptor subunit TctC